jgi:aminocarboxymuconate-semialdehyde decarboxylase
VVASRLKHDARYYLGKLYFDAVAYGSEELGFVSDVITRAERYAGKSVKDRSFGSKRMLFGTDHPFFPPLAEVDKWRSVVENLEAIASVEGWSEEAKEGVRGGNALELFELESP